MIIIKNNVQYILLENGCILTNQKTICDIFIHSSHRCGLPAIYDTNIYYMQHGKYHRRGGPAIIKKDLIQYVFWNVIKH